MNTAVDVSWLLLEIDLLAREKNYLLKKQSETGVSIGLPPALSAVRGLRA